MGDVTLSAGLVQLLGVTMVAYVLVMFGISVYAQGRVKDTEDYVVAGRGLTLPLATATLLATWFGAGTLMTATDEVRAEGVTAATLDPLGAGLCLLLVGLFFAAPLWREKLVTLPELFGRRYGPAAQKIAATLMIPPYLGWIAAQYIALASILHLFFGVPLVVGVAVVALVGVGYTLMGGMWAVTLTDAAQIVLMLAGLLIMAFVILGHIGDGSAMTGLAELWTQTPPGKRHLIPSSEIGPLMGWLGVLAAGSLGNIPSQDVMQRVFSAKSASVARLACIFAGLLYLSFGVIPVILGLAGGVLFTPEQKAATLPLLAGLFLHPALAVVFVLTLLSAVLSTIDSALLAPATVLARDLINPQGRFQEHELTLVRASVVLIGLLSLALAYMGEGAYELLESGYELGMVSLMAPLTFAIYRPSSGQRAVLASMLTGTLVWFLHMTLGWEDFLNIADFWIPMGLVCTLLSFLTFPIVNALKP